MKYAIVAFLWTAVAGCAANAQTYKVHKLYAYSRVQLPGMITAEQAMGETPVRHTVIYTVYMESSSKQLPQITAAWIDGSSYEATAVAIPENKVAAGVSATSRKQVTIQALKGRYVYRIELQPAEVRKKLPAIYQSKASGKVLLQLRLSGRDSLQLTGPIEALEPLEMY